MKYSTNEKAEEIVGFRFTDEEIGKGIISFDLPESFNYICPICGNKHLDWSEYNYFLWCEKCNKDIFTPLCIKNIDEANMASLTIIKHYKINK